MTDELVLTNARIVTAEAVVDGTLVVRDGLIAEVADDAQPCPRCDRSRRRLAACRGWSSCTPTISSACSRLRPGVRWPADAAMLTHDSQVAAAGITTVGDAVCVGFYGGKSERLEYLSLSIEVLHRAQAARALKAEHFLHLRLEIVDPHMLELFEPLMAEPSLRIVSFMDHTPGQRQWHDIDRFRTFSLGRDVGSEAEFQALIARRVRDQQRACASGSAPTCCACSRGMPPSGPATTTPRPSMSPRPGLRLHDRASSRPRIAAAEAARAAGMGIVMGAPNLVMGGSHSGNVSAAELVEQRPARRLLLRLRAGEPAPGGLPAARGLRHPDAGGHRSGDPHARRSRSASPTVAGSPRACGPIWSGYVRWARRRPWSPCGARVNASPDRIHRSVDVVEG